MKGVRVRLELHVLNLFGRKSWNHYHFRWYRVLLDCCNNTIKDKMPSPVRTGCNRPHTVVTDLTGCKVKLPFTSNMFGIYTD